MTSLNCMNIVQKVDLIRKQATLNKIPNQKKINIVEFR